MSSRIRWLEPVTVLMAVALLAWLLMDRRQESRSPTTSPSARPAVGSSPASRTPSPATPAQQYADCAHNLEAMMAELRSTCAEGAAPMLTVQAVCMRYRCPAADKPTYSGTGDGTMANTILFCRGTYHAAAGIPENFPDIHSQRGLNRGFDPEGKLNLPSP